jgi:hypothetical protein
MHPYYLGALVGGLLIGALLNFASPMPFARSVVIPMSFLIPTVALAILVWWTEIGRRNEAFKYLCAAAWAMLSASVILFTSFAAARLFGFSFEEIGSGGSICFLEGCRAGLQGWAICLIPSWVIVGVVGTILSLTIQDRLIAAFYSSIFKPINHRFELWQVGLYVGVYCFVVATFTA